MDSEDADTENKDDNGSTLLCVFERGYIPPVSTSSLFPTFLSFNQCILDL